jgi:uncharacterized protein YbbC (DUF1343 family)
MNRILLLSGIFSCLLMIQSFGQDDPIFRLNRRMITQRDIRTGAERTELYLSKIQGRRVAVMANHTTLIGNIHLIDSLARLGVKLVKIFSPEHGFRGKGEAGEYVVNGIDEKTGIPVISLYGNKVRPSKEDLHNIDIIIFDIQDVGVRFYTYASSMQYLMEACAENHIPMILLDRPNPNGYFIDGPVLKEKYRSFVGLNPVPLVHGLTLGEYASMINGEGWLAKGRTCDLTVIPVYNYNHSYLYQLPVAPSPNLPTMAAIYLYPSLGLFEGTKVSVGRGTNRPFQLIGYPGLSGGNISFTPASKPGFSSNPPYKDQVCQGYDLTEFSENFLRDSGILYLFWLIEIYKQYPSKKKFFNAYFDKLAGTNNLREQIQEGLSETEIRKSWSPDLAQYKKLRKKYLLYPDFE